ncbi:hypothetical protein [Desulfocurvus vexinensis]|nr:hypothetical protein [Desulfocurvus vexinensis]
MSGHPCKALGCHSRRTLRRLPTATLPVTAEPKPTKGKEKATTKAA